MWSMRLMVLGGVAAFLVGLGLVFGGNGGHQVLVWVGVLLAVAGAVSVTVGSLQAPQPGRPREKASDLEVAGVVLAIVLPVAGFVAGAILMTRNAWSGFGVIVLSAVSSAVWVLVVALLAV